MTAPALTTFLGIAHPWMCDGNGHLNVRHHMAMFDEASFHLLDRVAGGSPTAEAGWADVRCEIDYLQEIRAGTALRITSSVQLVGSSSITLLHELSGSDGSVRARARIVTVRFDTDARRSMPLRAEERSRAEALQQAAEADSVTTTEGGSNEEHRDE